MQGKLMKMTTACLMFSVIDFVQKVDTLNGFHVLKSKRRFFIINSP
jgi:hypothetical protein